MTEHEIWQAHRTSNWSRWTIVVAGIGVAGFSCADALMQLGAHVIVVDAADGPRQREKAQILQALDVPVHLGFVGELPACDLLVVSPGLRPDDRLILQAQQAGIAVWGELELAWRLRSSDSAAAWLLVTGTNGKTTTTMMLESMLAAAGYKTCSAGNIGNSLVDVVMHDDREVIAVEVGAPQLPFVYSIAPVAAACLNIADDHIDHFGSMEAYVAAKGKVFERTQEACIYNVQDPITEALVAQADVQEGCRAIGFTLGSPGLSMLGVVDEYLVDRAFIENRADHAQELALISDVHPAAPHNVANALAAAGLARAFGVPAGAVQEGLRAFTPAAHRIAEVRTVSQVTFVDDSKATNCHAAQTSLLAYEHVVWIAGGMAKGQSFDELVQAAQPRLRAAIVMGVDQEVIAQALARHAPDVPVVCLSRTETGAMEDAVRLAFDHARPGDTVLLAPGCASWDMFRDYGHRGDVFAAAVSALEDR